MKNACPLRTTKATKILPADCLLMVLMRLRLNLPLEDLAYRFSISMFTASEIFQEWIDLVFVKLRLLIVWPSQEIARMNVLQIFKDLFNFRIQDVSSTVLRFL